MDDLHKRYKAVKDENPDHLLFYRCGDFYECLDADAETVAGIIGLTITRYGKSQGLDIPMCGLPVHSIGPHITKLIAAGHKVTTHG